MPHLDSAMVGYMFCINAEPKEAANQDAKVYESTTKGNGKFECNF